MINILKVIFVAISIIVGFVVAAFVTLHKIQYPQLTDIQIATYSWEHYWWALVMLGIATIIASTN